MGNIVLFGDFNACTCGEHQYSIVQINSWMRILCVALPLVGVLAVVVWGDIVATKCNVFANVVA